MKRLLLIDDDEDQLSIRHMLLAHHGFESSCATTPDAAMVLARNDQPGVAVVDLGLPTEDQGWRLISRLKQIVPGISIVVLTGCSAAATKSHPEGQYVNAWITKGSGASALIETLNHLAA